MVEALQRAISLPVVNDGWFWAEREDAARELIDIAFEGKLHGLAEFVFV